MDSGAATVGQLVTALRQMGADYVYDTTFSADLTIMEEGTELLHRLQAGDLADLPMFTSCCPGWVRFLKSQYPDLTGRLSTAKSPQQMFGAVAKTWLAQRLGCDPKDIFSISIMPCVAKKAECELPGMQSVPDAGNDVDLVLTTREFARMARAEHIDVPHLEESPFDTPLGDGTGAGVIFGATGGVMEAALRSAYFLTTGENPPADAFREVRGDCRVHGWREATFDLGRDPGTLRRSQRPVQCAPPATSNPPRRGQIRICRDHGLPGRLRGRRRPAGRRQRPRKRQYRAALFFTSWTGCQACVFRTKTQLSRRSIANIWTTPVPKKQNICFIATTLHGKCRKTTDKSQKAVIFSMTAFFIACYP